jgi:hypothetical protein
MCVSSQASIALLCCCGWQLEAVILFFAMLLLQAVLEFKWETFAGGWVKFEFM